jgi:hypothetical protein
LGRVLLLLLLLLLLQTHAEYQRKASVLVELLAAVQSEAAGQEVLQQKLAAFRVEVDEALLHMVARRLEAARQLEQVWAGGI